MLSVDLTPSLVVCHKLKNLYLTEMSAETQLGISEFLTPQIGGFQGVIKERFSDFNVYELDKAQQVVRLNDQHVEKGNKEQKSVDDIDYNYSSVPESVKALLSDRQFSMIKMLNSDATLSDPIRIKVSDVSKEERKEVHSALKRFPNIEANTSEMEGEKYIEVKHKKKCKSGGRRDWPRERPKYLHFTLYKENMETYEAISHLSKKCRTEEKHFGTAGTKDRRGRTTQRVSVSMVSAEQILGAAKQINRIEVGNFNYEKNEIKLGDLTGNRFEIGVRNVDVSNQQLESVMKSFRDTGFINYFGTQRFGTQGVPTHEIGKELLMGNYSAVIDLILKPRENESMLALKQAREVWKEERDAHKALQILRSNRKDRTIEGKLLLGLSKRHENDSIGALNEIPRHQRLLYVHALQSYIWNQVVSKRIRVHGTKVLKGDLVRSREINDETACKEDLLELVDDVDKFDIHDVILPIPGTKVRFPDNDTKSWYEDFLAEAGLSLESFDSSVKDYKLPGDYRRLIIKPSDVHYQLTNYQDPVKDLILSDLEKLQKNSEANIDDDDDGKFRALILKFSLPSSSYATMALREIMKIETDKSSMMRTSKQDKLKRDQCAETEIPAKILKLV